MKKVYSDLLKDPRWQKKRLEILERDQWQCVACWDNKTTLNVHHIDYVKRKKPWEYEDDELVTLCDDCHNELHSESKIQLGSATCSHPNDQPPLIKIKQGQMMVMIYDWVGSNVFSTYIATYIDNKKVSFVEYTCKSNNVERIVK